MAVELYDRLKADYPEFSMARSTTDRLARAKVSWREILQRKGRN